MATTSDLVAAYIKLRDKKKEMAERHKEELAPLTGYMAKIEALLLSHLNEQGQESVRTENGTFFKTLRDSVIIDNWEEAWDFIMDNGMEHMIEHRLNKTAVKAFLEANNELPPGVRIENEIVVQVRR